jgi:hypothetical protein
MHKLCIIQRDELINSLYMSLVDKDINKNGKYLIVLWQKSGRVLYLPLYVNLKLK